MVSRERTENLIIQTAFLGDVLLGVPLYKNMKRIGGDGAKLTLLCRRGLGDFVLRSGLVDEAIEVDKTSTESWSTAVKELRRRRFDWLISPHESMRSTWLSRGLQAARKVGYQHPLAVFAFDHRVRRPMELPEALRQLALLEPLEPGWNARLDVFAKQQSHSGGLDRERKLLAIPEWAEMTVPALLRLRGEFKSRRSAAFSMMSDSARMIAEEQNLSEAKRIAVIAPGSVWPTKMWTSEGFAAVARRLIEEEYRVLLLGTKDEVSVCEEIARQASGTAVIAGQTALFGSAEVLALADVFVGNDSGAMHLAACAGVPSVSVFGPTILDFGYRPWQSHARVVEVSQEDLRCRPCGKHGAKKCPIGTHECMTRVSAEEVFASVHEVLRKT